MKTLNNCRNNSELFIICLDDDIEFLNSLKMSLTTKFQSEANYNLLFLDNPFESLDVIRDLVEHDEPVALIMSDQMMPGMKGVDFLMETRKITPSSMRVLLTGHAGMDSAIVAINENILHKYLTKPVDDIEDLVLTLKRLLNEYILKNTVDKQHKIILDLYKFANTLNSFNSTEEILGHIISFTRDTLNCDRISILLLEGETLTIKASVGIPEEICQRIRIPLGTNISGRVLKDRRPLLVEDIDKIPWIEKKINSEFKSFISTPVICAELCSFDIPLGVINVTNKINHEPFDEQDLKILSFIANTASIAINNQQNGEKLEQSYFDTIKALIMALEARDRYTKGHSMRVMEYAAGIAKQMGLDENTIKTITDAAILHDIGKIGIRDDVLLKAGRLDPDELLEIQKHSEISGAIVKSISSLQEVGLVVRQHHERYDGKGYPDKLKGEEIHIGARILAVADSYDAMTSNRPYRKPLNKNDVIDELKSEASAQFDPKCVDALIRHFNCSSLEDNKTD